MKDGLLEIGDQVHFRKRKGGAVSYGTVVAIQYVIRTDAGKTMANVENCSAYANTMPPRVRHTKAYLKRQEEKRCLYERLIDYAKSFFVRSDNA